MATKYLSDAAVIKAYYSAAFNTIGSVLSVNGPDMSAETPDATTMDSTKSGPAAGGAIAREFLQGIVDYGEVSISMLFDPADNGHEFLCDSLGAGTIKIQLTEPDGVIVWPKSGDWNVFVTAISPARALGEAFTCDVTFKTTGALKIPSAT